MFVNVDNYIDEIKQALPHFVFYRRGYESPVLMGFGDYFENRKNSKLTDCYCTACHERYEDGVNKPSEYKHKTVGRCARCGAVVERRSMGYSRSRIWEQMNFAVFEGAGDIMRISCIKAYLRFKDPDDFEPEYDWYEVTRYQLEPQKAVQYYERFLSPEHEYKWTPKASKPSEPNFARGGFYADRHYTLINRIALCNSFLKYIDRDMDERASDSGVLPSPYIEWLCRYAEHPQLEYIMHGGLQCLAEDYVLHRVKGVRFNWKSNDLKKILRLSKSELLFMQEQEGTRYEQYIRFRRDVFQGRTAEETVKYFKEFRCSEKLLLEINQLTGLKMKKVMDYTLRKMNKEGAYFFCTCYRDYLNDCKALKYDLTDTAITMPKDLFKMHDRVAKILKVKEDEILKQKMQELVESRQAMEVTDMELGLSIRQPYSIKEIVKEGRKLQHCVGGYADRHAAGKLTILFLRKLSDPFTPYYTMEVSNDLRIVQCRGYKNNMAGNTKPEEIEIFEERYQEYLDHLKAERMKAEKKAKRKQQKQKKAKTAA